MIFVRLHFVVEKADKIAKEVIDLPIYDTKFPYSDLKPRICQYVNSVFQDRWNNCNANKLHEINDTFSPTLQIYADNRKEDIKLTRLRIGHSRLTHKHYLLNEDSPECIPCHRPLTVKHILKQKSLATQNLVGILFIIKIPVLKMD